MLTLAGSNNQYQDVFGYRSLIFLDFLLNSMLRIALIYSSYESAPDETSATCTLLLACCSGIRGDMSMIYQSNISGSKFC